MSVIRVINTNQSISATYINNDNAFHSRAQTCQPRSGSFSSECCLNHVSDPSYSQQIQFRYVCTVQWLE